MVPLIRAMAVSTLFWMEMWQMCRVLEMLAEMFSFQIAMRRLKYVYDGGSEKLIGLF